MASMHFAKITKIFEEPIIHYINELQYLAEPSLAVINIC